MQEITLDFERFEELIKKEQELETLYHCGVVDWVGYPNAMSILEEINKQK